MSVYLLANEKEILFTKVDSDGKFQFTKVLPGSYAVEVRLSQFCWEQRKFYIELEDKDITNIAFKQKGYALPYESSHSFDIKAAGAEGTKDSIKKIEKGKDQMLCFEKKGSYTLTPQACFKFEKETFTFDTSEEASKTPLKFQPVEFQVGGTVVLRDAKELEKIKMTWSIKGKDNGTMELLKTDDKTIYKFESYFKKDQMVLVEPVIKEESSLLFYPKN